MREESLNGYLLRVCFNIGMHYLRKVRDDVWSLDEMVETRGYKECCNYSCLGDMYDVLDEKMEDEKRYEMLEELWDRLSDVDRMILECYYFEGCRMEEIAKKVGYKNGNSVKSRKKMVLNKMMKKVKKINHAALVEAA